MNICIVLIFVLIIAITIIVYLMIKHHKFKGSDEPDDTLPDTKTIQANIKEYVNKVVPLLFKYDKTVDNKTESNVNFEIIDVNGNFRKKRSSYNYAYKYPDNSKYLTDLLQKNTNKLGVKGKNRLNEIIKQFAQ
jgi:hypothetical protein